MGGVLSRAPAENESSHGKDVTKPGAPTTRTAAMRATEEHGAAPLIWNPFLNKGTAFSFEEREAKRLSGLLPPVVETLELQAERVLLQLKEDCNTPLQKYELIAQIAGTNQTLYYKVLIDNFQTLAPVVYTPTVGEACQKFDRIYRSPLGVYVSAFLDRGKFQRVLSNWFSHNVQIIVVTDGGRILGLGDLGTNGMGIPIGKIGLYVSGGGFHPEHSLPVTLDCGTDNQALLEDKFYLGQKSPRIHGDEHMEIMREFCMAVKNKWPNCLIQFEDFQTDKAFRILEEMQDKVLCFNDDIQGTGAVVTAGFINGMKAQNTELKDARVVFYGAGSSAVGVATMIAKTIEQHTDLTMEEAKSRIFMVDSKGLITTTRGDELPEHKRAVARTDDTPNMKELKDVVEYVKPHVLIGLTGGGGSFDKAVIEELCQHADRPLVFPLSNPTSQSEVTAENAYAWSGGKCIFASGSPFDPVNYHGDELVPGQANNVFIFPGVGFGAVMVKAKKVSDEMLAAAAAALADYTPIERINAGTIYPDIKQLRDISAKVATAVGGKAIEQGLAQIDPPADLESYIRARMWSPGEPKFDASNPTTV